VEKDQVEKDQVAENVCRAHRDAFPESLAR
jgi:hypothetical protein